MKPPPPRLPAAGIDDGERVADRDRGVDGVAAALEHVDADLARQVLRGHDHAVLGRHRRRPTRHAREARRAVANATTSDEGQRERERDGARATSLASLPFVASARASERCRPL